MTARLLLLLAIAWITPRLLGAAELAHHFNSSAQGQPRGDAGLSMSIDRMRVSAGVALRGQDGATEVLPRVTSNLALSRRVGIETRVDMTEWNSDSSRLDGTVATRLHVRPSTPLLDEFEGKVWHRPSGETGRLVRFAFEQQLRDGGPTATPITLRTRATFETTSAEGERLAVETEVQGIKSSEARGRASLRLRIARSRGRDADSSRSLNYDRSWTLPSAAQLGFNLGMLQTSQPNLETSEPSLGVRWRAQF